MQNKPDGKQPQFNNQINFKGFFMTEIKATSTDTIVYTSLRPMDEARIGYRVMFFIKTVDIPFIGYVCDNQKNVHLESRGFKKKSCFVGWVPLPACNMLDCKND